MDINMICSCDCSWKGFCLQCLQCGRPRFNPWVRKSPWRRKWQPTPVFLSGESHRQRSLVGYNPWGHKESDTTEWLTLLYTLYIDGCSVGQKEETGPIGDYCNHFWMREERAGVGREKTTHHNLFAGLWSPEAQVKGKSSEEKNIVNHPPILEMEIAGMERDKMGRQTVLFAVSLALILYSSEFEGSNAKGGLLFFIFWC